MEKKEKKFEEKLDELEKIVKALEQGDIELDQAIKSLTLAKECDNDLKKAEKALVNIVDESGNIKEFKDEEEKWEK